MNVEVCDAWKAELRSGNKRQGTNYLRDDNDGYCCLGVAAEVMRERFPERLKELGIEIVDATDNYMVVNYSDDGFHDSLVGTLPHALLDELGLNENSQEFLIQMNDREGKTFAEIADWLDQN